ncbi:MAG: SPOR domain-containing protein [Bacteroidota bacterium]
MRYISSILLLLSILCIGNTAGAQTTDTTQEANSIVVHVDPRIDVLVKKGEGDDMDIYNGRGYRVQIYSGNDRVKATETKVAFMRKFPGVKTYMTYVSPQFRVKVGDYRSRAEAQKMYNDAGSICNPCMIVPDNVFIVNIKKDD